MRGTLLGFAAALVTAGAGACNRQEPGEPPAPMAAAEAAAPRDHLAEGELLEGTERAFGLVLPRGVTIDSDLPPQILASGAPKAADVANYIRARVTAGNVKVGAASTLFTEVQVPSDPRRLLSIRVETRASGTGALVTVRDVTPPPVDPTLTEDQRWKQVGIAPGGRVIDPSHLH